MFWIFTTVVKPTCTAMVLTNPASYSCIMDLNQWLVDQGMPAVCRQLAQHANSCTSTCPNQQRVMLNNVNRRMKLILQHTYRNREIHVKTLWPIIQTVHRLLVRYALGIGYVCDPLTLTLRGLRMPTLGLLLKTLLKFVSLLTSSSW